jgi:hypothetical protein
MLYLMDYNNMIITLYQKPCNHNFTSLGTLVQILELKICQNLLKNNYEKYSKFSPILAFILSFKIYQEF